MAPDELRMHGDGVCLHTYREVDPAGIYRQMPTPTSDPGENPYVMTGAGVS